MKGLILSFLTSAALALPLGASLIISDSFDGPDSTTLGAADVGGTWTNVTGLGVVSNEANYNGSAGSGIYIAQLNYSPTVLSSGDATWGFNGRYARSSSDPDWSSRGGYGMILAADNNDIRNAASGYALVTGDFSTGTNSLALVSFTGGFDPSNWTEIIAAPGGFVGNQQARVTSRVEYTASTNTWQLYADSGGASFSDPLGTVTSRGTAVNSLYTGNSMVSSGLSFFTTGASLTRYQFDNVSFSQQVAIAAIPEPSSITLLGIAGLGLFLLRRRRQV